MTEETHDEYQVCYKHPDRKTYLRCNKCGRPICMECAVQTPTGYRCKECVKNQQKVFDTAEGKDYIIGGIIAFALGLAGSLIDQLIPVLPPYITAFIVGGAFGKLIGTAVRAAVNKRRSEKLTLTVVVAAGIGGLLPRLIGINVSLTYFIGSGMLLTGVLQILINLLYVLVLCFTIWYDMNGMVFRR